MPGGDIETDELIREVRLFVDNFFGGAEIQPFVAGVNPQTRSDPSAKIYDYDSPAYYEKIVAVLEQAKQQGLQIDLTMGSSWPPGGTFVPLEDNPDTLLYGEATISQAVDMPVPQPIMPFSYAIFSKDSVLPLLRGREWTRTLNYYPDAAKLVTVIAAKITENHRSPDPSVLTDTMHLDIETTIDIGEYVSDGQLRWQPPSSGDWQVIAIYTMPSGSEVLNSAVVAQQFVVDPFDSGAIGRYYDNWIGKHPELLSYAGSTLRALFSDSYEYFAQRMFSDDLIETFRANRGYDVTPYLPAVFQPARDQFFFFFTGLQTAPDFSYGELSARIIHDYDLTVSDLFFKHWYPASREWIESRNLQFRQQGYNPPLDIIKAAGAASIPETEGGNELWLKRVASGGHLYGRPIISAESFVFFPQGGFALSPQDYKQGIDVLMTAGVNHIIYHGTPYKWDEPGYGEIGWSPFTSPYGSNISSTISEADSFWKYQHIINTYAARLQLLLRTGSPDADLLVYLPVFDDPDDERFAPAVQTVNASGYAWEWVNDDSLLSAEWTDDGLQVGTMTFQGIVIPDVPAMPVETADQLLSLAETGLPVMVLGQMPSQQPGYFNYVENDQHVATAMQSVMQQTSSLHAADASALLTAIHSLPPGRIRYETNPSMRIIRRDYGDGQCVAFVRNTSPEANEFTLHLDETLSHCYWLDAQTGKVYAAQSDDNTLSGWLPGFGSIAVLGGAQPVFGADEINVGSPVQQAVVTESIALTDWQLRVVGDDVPGGEFAITSNALGDWSQHETLQAVSSQGVYTTTFALGGIQDNKRYVLDLGVVFSAADVTVNGREAGSAIFSPYQVDVTDHLTAGHNTITVTVTPALKNRLLAKAKSGDPEYRQFIAPSRFGFPRPTSSGLVGPVSLNIQL